MSQPGSAEQMVDDAVTTVRNAIDQLQGAGSYPENVILRQQRRVDAGPNLLIKRSSSLIR